VTLAAPAGAAAATLAAGVRVRPEPFGYLAYVGDRDHFFAVDRTGAPVLDAALLGAPMAAGSEAAARVLGRFGVLESDEPRAFHHGVSLLGDFAGVPAVERPLVVNCFATAECPLRCRYCYADDLMRASTGTDVDRVAATASAVPAMVAVLTGGEPLFRPDLTAALIDRLAGRFALVLDTSGVGDLDALLPALVAHRVHLRVSLDAVDASANDRLRPLAGRHRGLAPGGGPAGTGVIGSGAAARETLRRAAAAGVATTVQTVVTAANHDPDTLRRLRDDLIDADVRNWVLHVLVSAGKAADPRNAVLRPAATVRHTLADLVRDTTMAELALNIRATATDSAANCALVIGGRGDLYVEGDYGGKVRIAGPDDPADRVLAALARHVSPAGAAGRYLNGSIQAFGPGLVATPLAAAGGRDNDRARRGRHSTR
jgi:MoaA/NifB/PqqE/SkfB family radical SAM enzyme